MIIQYVKFKSKLSEEELMKRIEERKPRFRKIPELIQKYYVKDPQTGEVGGIYLWDSKEAMMKFRESDLSKSIPQTYEIEGAPKIEILNLYFPLRE